MKKRYVTDPALPLGYPHISNLLVDRKEYEREPVDQRCGPILKERAFRAGFDLAATLSPQVGDFEQVSAFATLLLSCGVPPLFGGDELGGTRWRPLSL